MSALVFALVGAESTGKSTLAPALAERIGAETGLACTYVDEVLRNWCERWGRVPRPEEQRAVAEAQQRSIEQAASRHDVVIADTTALMVGVYSRLVYGDRSLEDWAAAAHAARVDHTLLTALDLPWVPDGVQRDGEHVRVPVDSALRELMTAHRIGWSLVAGSGPLRLERAYDAVAPWLRARAPAGSGLFTRLAQRDAAQPAWRCEHCDDPDCEHRLRNVAG